MRMIIAAVIILLACSCSPDPQPEEAAIKTYDTSTLYYDIPLAVQNEINEIKRRLSYTYRLDTENGKTDSTEIDSTALMQLASPFLQYNLNNRQHRKYYKESLFEDGDTKSIVLNYTTNHPDLPVRSASILLDNSSQHLKRIDIMKSHTSKDTTYDERISWVAGKYFQLVYASFIGEKQLSKKQTQVFWRDR